MLPAARPYPFAAGTVDHVLGTGLIIVTGWSIEETTGSAAAAFELYDGRDATGTLVACGKLAQATSDTHTVGANGLACHVGVFLHRVSGTLKGTVWGIPGQDYDGLAYARGVRPVWAGDDR